MEGNCGIQRKPMKHPISTHMNPWPSCCEGTVRWKCWPLHLATHKNDINVTLVTLHGWLWSLWNFACSSCAHLLFLLLVFHRQSKATHVRLTKMHVPTLTAHNTELDKQLRKWKDEWISQDALIMIIHFLSFFFLHDIHLWWMRLFWYKLNKN